jgi:hypothetical protein
VVLHLSHNPHPLVVAWAGPVLPLAAFGIAAAKMPGAYLLRSFAGFSLVANGAYLGAGSGLLLWHRLGPHFGLGEGRGRVSRAAAVVTLVLLALVVSLELVLGGE